MIAGLGQLAVHVRDTARAKAFYRDVLGLRFLFDAGDLSFFECGGVRLMLERSAEFDHPNPAVYYRVDDIEAAYAALRDAGVSFRGAPDRVYRLGDVEGWMAFFEDTEGNTLALMQERRAP